MGAWGTFLTALLVGNLCKKTNALVQWFSKWGPWTCSGGTQELVSASAHFQAPPQTRCAIRPRGDSAAAPVGTHSSDH